MTDPYAQTTGSIIWPWVAIAVLAWLIYDFVQTWRGR